MDAHILCYDGSVFGVLNMWKVDTQISLYNMPRAPSMMILKQVYRTC